jgi:endoglucanase
VSERPEVRPGSSTVEQPRIPRWRGFNLTQMVSSERSRPYLESDFALLAELGFDFVRLPLSYWCWSDPEHWERVDEQALVHIDRAIALAGQYGIHVHYQEFRGHQLDRQMLELLLAY